ncbi:uncharacterized protein C8Q71DRAFT_759408 [Rhodofomes roseus]|uniref:DUF6534 domain-containing protein n=1 Tax=Rhodofomes roseus TaxID=34475 RepID=A0ABQ8KHC3_9APHY|nr:uncharacterized protein C8Q71DRAFT_759408 [Rhodofomes roseus]KAH9836733.1 hypothetical protein C8Q71DRAFT_759408 [Rhodofomes roseus]
MSATAAEIAALGPIVRSTMGAIIIGMFFSSTFFGITLLQTYQYYDRYWSDAWWLKLFVAVITILDALQLVTVVHANWWYLIGNYANPMALQYIPWSLGLETGLTSSIGFLVQTFFAMRVYILSRGNGWMTGLIMLCALSQFVIGVYYTAAGQHTQLAATIETIIWASTAALACSIAGDVLITLSMCYYLYLGRSGIASSDRMIHVLIKYTVNTGLLTTLSAICTIILSETLPSTYWDTMFYFVVSKCYVNSTLATLNAREKLRQRVITNVATGGTTTGSSAFRASLSFAPGRPAHSAFSNYTEDSTASMFSGTVVGSGRFVASDEEDKEARKDAAGGYLV